MKRIGKMGLVACLVLMLSGCGCEKSEPLVRVVEKVEVVSHHGEETITRTYTQSRKMTAVLNYLRWLRPAHGADCNPEQLPGDDYTITVTLSDGEQEVYQQKTNGYLRKNQERWKNIDPEKGIMLYEIISQMEGDGPQPAADNGCGGGRFAEICFSTEVG